jgi:DNA-binding IclR family transcriptional regulator
MKQKTSRRQQGVQGVEIGLKIAFHLAEASRALPLGDIAKAAGLAPSKVHRYLVSLGRAGVVEQNPSNNRYDLGRGAIMLGLAALSRLDVYRLADQTIQELYDEIGVGIAAMIWGNNGPTVIRRIEPIDRVMVTTRIGTVISVVSSAAGRLFAAFMPSQIVDPKIDAEFAVGRRFTSMGEPISRSDFRAIVEKVRKEQIALVRGDFLKGFDALAAPVFGHDGQIVLTISVIAAEGTIDFSADGRPIRALQKAARTLSARLGAPGFRAMPEELARSREPSG